MILESNLQIYVDDKLIKEVHNNYHNNIKDHLNKALYSNVTGKFIDSTNLFTTNDSLANNVGKDGIIIYPPEGSTYKTMITTEGTPTSAQEKYWIGTKVNTLSFDVEYINAYIGSSCNASIKFDTIYAAFTGTGILVPAGNTLNLQWHLVIGEAVL